MTDKRVVITGGAGFVGSNLAVSLASRHPDWEVVAADNLYRRGSELALPRLRDAGVSFHHADVRDPADLTEIGTADALVECSAEPSVMAAVDGSSDRVVQTNLLGAYNCLEFAARHGAQVIFLSTSRVYPVAALEGLDLDEASTRFELSAAQTLPGVSAAGIAEDFPLIGARTLYGATKLAGELLVTEYAQSHGLASVINRCGVIAGPWQMGKVDQGVFTFWMLRFLFGGDLSYIGFGGTGKQVRDLLHIDDLVDLLDDQLLRPDHWAGTTFNVGGGRKISLSLRELTSLCVDLTGRELPIGATPETRVGDVPIYLSDCGALFAHTDWRPQRTAETVLRDIRDWAQDNAPVVRGALGLTSVERPTV